MSFMGDSAGGNIALELDIYSVRDLGSFREATEGAQESIYPVESIFVICTATDLRNNNP
jgi:acetyl esterase/lipase